MFLDSSAMVAMIHPEPDAEIYASRLEESGEGFTTALHMFETVVALCRLRKALIEETTFIVEEFLRRARVQMIAIEGDDHVGALQAFQAYGKGTGHPAQLNMGDCFAYAVAKRLGLSLLYKGYDFKHTDLA